MRGGMIIGGQVVADGPADLTLGRLAARAGRHGEAAELLRDALALARRCGNPAWEADCRAALASDA